MPKPFHDVLPPVSLFSALAVRVAWIGLLGYRLSKLLVGSDGL